MGQPDSFVQAVIDNTLDIIQVFKTIRNEVGEIVDFTWRWQNSRGLIQNGEVVGKSLHQINPNVSGSGVFARMIRVVKTGIASKEERFILANSSRISGTTRRAHFLN